MEQVNIALAAVGALVLVLGLFSGWIRRSLLSEPLLALLAGVAVGPLGFNLLHFESTDQQDTVLEQAARLTLAIGLMGVALRLPPDEFFRRWRTLLVLLGLVMPVMWLVTGLLVYVVLGVPVLVALLVGAILTPNDPVVATSIVSGSFAKEKLPDRIRHTLSAESGANDGLAFAIVWLPILLLQHPIGGALAEWVVRVVLWEVMGGAAIGVILGILAGRLLLWAESQESIEKTSYLGYTTTLSLVVLGAVKLLQANAILAVIVAGVAFSRTVGQHERSEEESVQEAVNQFFLLPIFFLIGMAIPWSEWLTLGWSGVVLALGILLLRRLPALLFFSPWLRALRTRSDALFLGWFGPIGVSALFYAMHATNETRLAEIWPVASLVICASVLIHGITAAPFIRWYDRATKPIETDRSGDSFEAAPQAAFESSRTGH